MKKFITLLCAMLLTNSLWAGTEPAKLERVWENSVGNGGSKPSYMVDYAWNKSQRSMAYYEGKLYIPTIGDGIGTVVVVDAVTGAFIEDLEIPTLSAAPANGERLVKACLRITDDGFLLVGNTASGAGLMRLYVYDIAAKTTLISAQDITIAGIGRADYFDVYGNFDAAEEDGAYVSIASNAGNIVQIPMVGKAFITTSLPLTNAGYATAGVSTQAIAKSKTGAFVVGRAVDPGFFDYGTNTYVKFAAGLISEATNKTNSGGAYFEFDGKQYLVVASDQISKFIVLDVTAGAANATKVLESTFAMGTYDSGAQAGMTAIDVRVESDGVVIFVFSPGNGVGAFKFTSEKAEAKVVENPVFTPASGAFENEVEVTIACATVGAEIYYTDNGDEPTAASTKYTGKITLTKATTIKAIALLDGYTASAVVSATYDVTTGIGEGTLAKTKVYPANDVIVVETELEGAPVEVYTLQGQKITTVIVSGTEEIAVAKGIYVVKVGQDVFKVVL